MYTLLKPTMGAPTYRICMCIYVSGQEGADKIMSRHSLANLLQSDTITEGNGKIGFNPTGQGN
jgi:hypothetical protein